MKEKKERKKVYLKGIFESIISNILIVKIMFILFTIETLNKPFNQIISYLVLLGILVITIIIDIVILSKYGRNFKSMFEEE